jgi:quaternary ammonium compound-resistance protein SugE
MAWITLAAAGAVEVFWALCLKASHGFTRLWPAVFAVAGMVVSFWLLNLAVRELPIGTAYAVWTGIGAVGTAVLGAVLFHEPVSPAQVIFLAMIACGIVGLKLVSA